MKKRAGMSGCPTKAAVMLGALCACLVLFSCSGVLYSKSGNPEGHLTFVFNPDDLVKNRQVTGARSAIGSYGAVWTRVEVRAAIDTDTQTYQFKREPTAFSDGAGTSDNLVRVTIKNVKPGAMLKVSAEVYGVSADTDGNEMLMGYGESDAIQVTGKTTAVTITARSVPIRVLKRAAGGTIKAYSDSAHTNEIANLAALAAGTTVYLKAFPDDATLEVTDIQGADTYTPGSDTASVVLTDAPLLITPAFGTIDLTITGSSVGVYIGTSTTVIIPARKAGAAITSIDDNAFHGRADLQTIHIPDGVESIGNSAFKYCSSLQSVTMPASITDLGVDTFSGCSSLTSITLPENLESISGYVFVNCTSLTEITIPAGVTSIGNQVFSYCSALNTVRVEAPTPPTLGSNVFENCTALNSIYVPLASVGKYNEVQEWLALALEIKGF